MAMVKVFDLLSNRCEEKMPTMTDLFSDWLIDLATLPNLTYPVVSNINHINNHIGICYLNLLKIFINFFINSYFN